LADIYSSAPKLRRVVVMVKQNSSIFDPTVLESREPGKRDIINSLLLKKNNSCEKPGRLMNRRESILKVMSKSF